MMHGNPETIHILKQNTNKMTHQFQICTETGSAELSGGGG